MVCDRTPGVGSECIVGSWTRIAHGRFASNERHPVIRHHARRPDRSGILDAWIEGAVTTPVREVVQAAGRIRRWAQITKCDGRYLRVVLLADGETVHNAFDRGFRG